MTEEKRRYVEASPKFVFHREVIDAVDTGFGTLEDDWVDFTGFEYGIAQVIPSGGAHPSVAIVFLSEQNGDGGFFSLGNPFEVCPEMDPDKPFQMVFKAQGKKTRALVATGIGGPGQSVKIFFSGFNQTEGVK